MNFLSIPFLLFLPVAGLLSRMISSPRRWIFLLIVSLVFIGLWSPGAMAVLVVSSFLTFYAALCIGSGKRFRWLVYCGSLLLQAICLFLLKYVESENSGLHFLFREAGFRADFILYAIGFSFYTLQHIAYLTDVFFLRIEAEKNPFSFLLFSAFFAKFNSGPVERAQKLLPQFRSPYEDRELISEGLQRVVLGVFKKMVLADRLAPAVSHVFGVQQEQGSAVTVVGVCLFTFQLYFDFSAYSDIAIGSAKLFGIKLTENFDRPFSSSSVSEFWRRWHISLISWFSNYIYYPLTFRLRKYGKVAVITGIGTTFLLSGMWHGLGMTFFVWSLLHATYLSFEVLTRQFRSGLSARIPPSLYTPVSILLTFALVCFSNIFFRAADLGEAKRLLSQLVCSPFHGKGCVEGFIAILAGGGYQEVVFNLGLTVSLVFVFLVFEKRLCAPIARGNRLFIKTFCLLVLIFVFGVFKQADYFIYQQF
jgi:alginate O-acetyltransferase complex protein AlgI